MALAEAVTRLAQDRELREHLGRMALRDVEERFNPKVEALRFARFLRSFGADRSPPLSNAITNRPRSRSA
jgi:glycosyltransferase involved in cell wall biosynthesis